MRCFCFFLENLFSFRKLRFLQSKNLDFVKDKVFYVRCQNIVLNILRSKMYAKIHFCINYILATMVAVQKCIWYKKSIWCVAKMHFCNAPNAFLPTFSFGKYSATQSCCILLCKMLTRMA